MARTSQRRDERQLRARVVIVVTLSVAAAGVHLGVAPAHGRQSLIAGAFFVAGAVAQLALSALLLRRPEASNVRALVAVNALLVGIWGLTRLVALPISGHDAPEAVGAVDALTVVIQLVGICFALIALRSPALRRASRQRAAVRGLPALAGLVAVVAVTAPVAAAATDAPRHGTPAHHAPAATASPAPDHAQTAKQLFASMLDGLGRDGVCGPAEPTTTPDCRPRP